MVINSLHANWRKQTGRAQLIAFTTLLAFTGLRAQDRGIKYQAPEPVVSPDSFPNVASLNEVLVTAQKREEPLRNVPGAISVFTAPQVRECRLWNNKDLSGIVPALYIADPGDDRSVVSVRGITTTSYDPAVAFYVDGINQVYLDSYIPALLDVERIEVLRGPQGALYGRNAMGGVINIITRAPGNKASGFAEISAGNYGLQRYSAGYRTPLIKDRLFIAAAGLYDRRNGYYTNLFNGTSYDRQHSYTGNYNLNYRPGARWSLDLTVKHKRNRNQGAFPLAPDPSSAIKHPFRLNQNAGTTMIDNTFQSSFSAAYRGAAFSFRSQTAYQENYRYYDQPIDGDFSPLDAISIINNYGRRWNLLKALTEDLQFSSPVTSGSPWKWTVGTYWFYQEQPKKQATRFGIDAPVLGIGDSLFTTLNTTTSYKWGMAVYGQVSYTLTPRLELIAGLRYDREHQHENVRGEYQHDPNPGFILVRSDTAGSVAFHALSPRLALNYRLSPGSTFYAVYSRGFRTGGLTELSSDPSQPPLVGYRPEYSSNYELGVKNTLLSGALHFNGNIFYTHINDAQVPTLVLPDAITVIRNTGKLDNWGFESEIAAAPLKGLSLMYNFGYTHASYRTLKLSENGSEVDLEGRRQLFTPEFTSLFAAQYERRLGTHWRMFARGEWKWNGTTWFDWKNNIRQSPYSVFNSRCGAAFKQFELAFWARNIGNTKYISYAYDFGACHLGDPATWGLTFSVRW